MAKKKENILKFIKIGAIVCLMPMVLPLVFISNQIKQFRTKEKLPPLVKCQKCGTSNPGPSGWWYDHNKLQDNNFCQPCFEDLSLEYSSGGMDD